MKTNLTEDRDVDNEVVREHGVLEEQVRDLLIGPPVFLDFGTSVLNNSN